MKQPTKQNRGRNNKSSRRPSGNVANRVYDSSGPEGKVRGTPQQITEKYLTLARDAGTAGDRILSESFLQHAEHYQRLIIASQPQQQEQRRSDDAEQPAYENGSDRRDSRDRDRRSDNRETSGREAPSSSGKDGGDKRGSGGALETFGEDSRSDALIVTPESKKAAERATPAEEKPTPAEEPAEAASEPPAPEAEPAEEKPKKRRVSRKKTPEPVAEGEEAPKPKRATRTRKPKTPPAEPSESQEGAAAE